MERVGADTGHSSSLMLAKQQPHTFFFLWSFKARGQTMTRGGRTGNYLPKMPASHTCQNTDEAIIKDRGDRQMGEFSPSDPSAWPCFQLLLAY